MPRRRSQREALFDSSPKPAPRDCVTATVDGAARGNPGPAAYGVVFENARGQRLAQLGSKLGRATNNVAEYRALLAALAYARRQGWRALRVRTDSELLAQQLRGAFRVRSADLRPLHQEAKQLISGLAYFGIEAVPRRLTRAADKLANAALDGKRVSRVPRPARRLPAAGRAGGPATRGWRPVKSNLSPVVSATRGRKVRAVYKNGVLKPLDPLDLPDGTEVDLTIRRRS